MGEGEGIKDVSDEIENEDQLTGTGTDKDTPAGPREKPDKTSGVEMTTDFDGEMHDVEQSDLENVTESDEYAMNSFTGC